MALEWRMPADRAGRATACVVLAAVAIACLAGARYVLHRRSSPAPESMPDSGLVAAAAEPVAPVLQEITGTFAKNQTITAALVGQGLPRDAVMKLVEAARPVYNLARVVASRPYWLSLTQDGELHSFRYPVDDEHYLTVTRDGDLLRPSREPIPYVTRIEVVSGRIEASLLAAVSESGEQEILALDFADIFMWDVDFNTEIQPGASFRMLVEKKSLDGSFVRYGSILAAELDNEGRRYSAFLFAGGDGKPGYYGPDGSSLRKSFLKSPIPFARVSSRFSRARRHPILRIVRPHLGVDYAAPLGTPVVAVGAGTVTAAGWSGEGGRTVRIRHANGYETRYLHLSRIRVARGEVVGQGQLIGTVGQSGLATGPHLDFRVLRHGKYMNPAKAVFPPAPPVPPASFPQFAATRDRLAGELANLSN